MSKIICDVCGTAYPETATQCPICGFAKASDDQAVAAEASGEEVTYVHTKGGRYSRRNVRRRNRKVSQENRSTAAVKSDEGEESTNIGLIVVVIALLLAIIAVVIYIGIRFFAPADVPAPPADPSASQTEATELRIPCKSLELSNKTIEFRLAGNAWLLEAECTPADTTDKVTFTSANEKVAIVSEDGKVVAVGGGETVITVTCGDITRECQIICTFDSIEDSTEGTTEHVTSAPIDPNFEFKFNAPDKYRDPDTGKWDTTITTANSTWRAYKKDISVPVEDIIWTSDDPEIASVEKGIVTALTPGTTEIHAQYGGKTFTCIVRCSWKVQAAEPEGGDENTDEVETKGIRISTKDATVKVNESFYLRLIDANDKNIEVQWVASEEGYVTIEGNKITGVKGKLAGITVSTTYEGVTYSAIVRINAD